MSRDAACRIISQEGSPFTILLSDLVACTTTAPPQIDFITPITQMQHFGYHLWLLIYDVILTPYFSVAKLRSILTASGSPDLLRLALWLAVTQHEACCSDSLASHLAANQQSTVDWSASPTHTHTHTAEHQQLQHTQVNRDEIHSHETCLRPALETAWGSWSQSVLVSQWRGQRWRQRTRSGWWAGCSWTSPRGPTSSTRITAAELSPWNYSSSLNNELISPEHCEPSLPFYQRSSTANLTWRG